MWRDPGSIQKYGLTMVKCGSDHEVMNLEVGVDQYVEIVNDLGGNFLRREVHVVWQSDDDSAA